MSAFFTFYHFMEALMKGEHDLDGDAISVYLSNTAPDVETDEVKADLAEITNQYGYSPVSIQSEVTAPYYYQYRLVGTDLIITASGGPVGPFRYVVLFNNSHASDALIGYWDRGYSITLQDGEHLCVDLGSHILKIGTDTYG